MFKFYCRTIFSLITIAAFSFINAQTIPTTLEEIYGKDGIKVFEDSNIDAPLGGNWIQGTSMPFPRYYGGSVMYSDGVDEWLYVFGGDTTGSGDPTTSCLRYSVNNDTWEYIAPLPEPLRVNAAAKLGNKLYTMGGFNAPFPAPAVRSFYEYDIATDTWTQLPDLPVPLFFTGAIGFEDSLIYIIGGIEDVQLARGDLWSVKVRFYNIDESTFKDADDLPQATANFGKSIIGNTIYLTAGLKSETELWNFTYKGEINLSDRANINWTQEADYPLSLQAHYGYKFSDTEIRYLGGSLTTGFNPIRTTYSYNTNSNEYTMDEDLPYPAMAFYAGFIPMMSKAGPEIITTVITGGITTGPMLTGQTWIRKDTLSAQGINEIGNSVPDNYSLSQNYPNPFNPSTTIKFSVPEESFVSLKVYNALGEIVTELVSETLSAGVYEYSWEGVNLPSGIYFYTLTANNFTQTKKFVLLK